MTGLRLDEATLEIGGRRLFEGLCLRCDFGACVSPRAPSGAGKTTLLRALAGLTPLEKGTLTLDGEAPASMGMPRWRRRVVYLAQRPTFLLGSVRENLARPFGYATAEGAFPLGRAEALLERLGLHQGVLDQEARTLSVGEGQRVALVRALLLEPCALLLDEPTSALDPGAIEGLEGLLRERLEAGVALVWVTHDPDPIARLGAKVLELPS
ncbi:MAG: ATP-binding cassette domain-containing protein [Myxococcales bacterium]|nr:ATP-binding cassette domain-containing protein [Myxococcales bacterium]